MLPDLRTPIPGPKSLALAATLRRYESRNVTFTSPEFPIFWERADGTNVWDADGNRFLDLTSGFGVTGLGHGATAIRAAAHAQIDQLLHAMGDVHPSPGKAALCQRLSEITFERWGHGTARTILANSGSESVEAALKTALIHTGKPGVISFTGGYHGLGHGALETAGLPYFRDPFEAQLGRFGVRLPFPQCRHCPFENGDPARVSDSAFPNCAPACLAELESQLTIALRKNPIGAILVEPVQGRGGEVVPPRAFLPLLRRLADAHGVVLIFDEIYTGFHRTGRLFACDYFDVVPDLICLGKGLTSGFPLSACVGRTSVMDSWPESPGEALHTSTFLGHPVGCAMALASLDAHADPATAADVLRAATALDDALASLESSHITDIRGLGLLRGIELADLETGTPDSALAGSIIVHALRDGIVLLAGGPAGNVLSLTPPFPISADEIHFAGGKIQEYLTFLPGSISKSMATRSVV